MPTVDHNRYYVDAKDEFQFAPETIPPLLAYIEKNLDAVRRAAKAGVRLAMGSDAVYSMFGQNTRELGWFVKAGMTPEQALRTATTTGAEMLGSRGSARPPRARAISPTSSQSRATRSRRSRRSSPASAG